MGIPRVKSKMTFVPGMVDNTPNRGIRVEVSTVPRIRSVEGLFFQVLMHNTAESMRLEGQKPWTRAAPSRIALV